jgi:DNA-binding transcriptional ArsR family regulator
MSHETYAWAKEQRCGDPVTKAVLMEIANWAKPTGVCEFLSVKRIAEVVEVSPRTVQRHLDRLESADLVDGGLGLLRRIERHREDGGRGANCFELIGYEMPLSLGQRPPRHSVTPPRQIVTSPRQNDGEPGDNGVTRLGDKIIPLTTPNGVVSPQPEIPDDLGEGQGEAEAPPAEAHAQRSRLPAEWTPPPIDSLQPAAKALVSSWPRGAYEAICEVFRLHWHGETRAIGRKSDWDAALAKWLIKEHPTVMRSAKAGVSYERLAAAAPASRVAPAAPVAEKAREGGTATRLRECLRRAVGDAVYRQWFDGAAFLASAGGLKVVCRTGFAAGYIEANFTNEILGAAKAAGMGVDSVSAVVGGQGTREDEAA